MNPTKDRVGNHKREQILQDINVRRSPDPDDLHIGKLSPQHSNKNQDRHQRQSSHLGQKYGKYLPDSLSPSVKINSPINISSADRSFDQ